MKRVDAHCHLWHLERGDYHWMNVNNPTFAPIACDFDVANLDAASKSADITKFIVVQAAATHAETEYLLSLSDKYPQIGGVVGWIDLAHQDAAAKITEFSKHPKFKGFRPMLQDIEDTDWLMNVPDPTIWQTAVENGLRFDALIKPRHLTMTHQFCVNNPHLPIVIDHAAKPELMLEDREKFDIWQADIAKIASETSALCKLSGLLTEMNSEQLLNPASVLKPVFEHLINCFGPDRLMWGSDWPVVRMAGDYDTWNNITMELLAPLDDTSRQAILGGTASKFYGIEETTS